MFAAHIAYADSMEELIVAHRGARTSKLGEGTLPAYQYAVKNRADILDGDIRWTKDGPDSDSVGTMVMLHDATLNRTTNCTGNVSSWLWSAIRDKCRTDVGGQKLLRLVDLLSYGNSVGKSFALEIKVSRITDAQAKQLWDAIKNSRVQLQATASRLDALNKIRSCDVADRKPHDQLRAGHLRDWGLAVGVDDQEGRHGCQRQAHNPSRCCAQLPPGQHQGVSVYRPEHLRRCEDDRLAAVRSGSRRRGPVPELARRRDWIGVADRPEHAGPIHQRLTWLRRPPVDPCAARVIPRPAIDVREYAAEEYQEETRAVLRGQHTIAPSGDNTASSESRRSRRKAQHLHAVGKVASPSSTEQTTDR